MHDHPIRGRANAGFLALLDGYMHAKYGELKPRLLGDVPSTVVELGPGAGANVRYYPPGTRLIAVEPNVRMHGPLRRRAARAGVALDLRALAGERLDLPDASADLVVATLVLCTVRDPAAVLGEVRRVLRPGGRFVCIEHVVAPVGSRTRALQRALARPWRWAFEGCDLCRDTAAAIRAVGFARADVQPIVMRTVFVPIRHQIAAVCVA